MAIAAFPSLEFSMIFTLLRVSGLNWQPTEMVARFQIRDASVWRAGDARRRGNYKDSGFSLSLPEHESWASAKTAIRDLLCAQKHALDAAAVLDLSVELSIGVTVGEENSYAPTLDFEPELLAALHAARVALSVTAYPTSDEQE